MKTKILVLAVLLFGGLLFTSCQKDDALLEDKAIEQSTAKDNLVEDQVSQWAFMLKNYPDPFYYYTTIEYHLANPGFVKLSVYQENSRKRIVLVSGSQRMGIYTIRFDASRLPSGEYIAELKVGNTILKENMTKKNRYEIDYDRPDEN